MPSKEQNDEQKMVTIAAVRPLWAQCFRSCRGIDHKNGHAGRNWHSTDTRLEKFVRRLTDFCLAFIQSQLTLTN